MVQKMQTYNEMNTTKGHPWIPQESQDYVLRSPNVKRNKSYSYFIFYYFLLIVAWNSDIQLTNKLCILLL